ncbi:MAG: hypothetical protein M5U12_09240 [Verrucomicrobia bacterium]|nr:hypothetical protein [Verrucomicrobiota bacterium]
MVDVARDNGHRVDVVRLEQELGVPRLPVGGQHARGGSGVAGQDRADVAGPVAGPEHAAFRATATPDGEGTRNPGAAPG